jgi:hypothetical protein
MQATNRGCWFSPPGAIDSCDPGRTTALSIPHIRRKRLHRLRDRFAPAGREVLFEQGRWAPVWVSFLAATRARQSFGTPISGPVGQALQERFWRSRGQVVLRRGAGAQIDRPNKASLSTLLKRAARKPSAAVMASANVLMLGSKPAHRVVGNVTRSSGGGTAILRSAA